MCEAGYSMETHMWKCIGEVAFGQGHSSTISHEKKKISVSFGLEKHQHRHRHFFFFCCLCVVCAGELWRPVLGPYGFIYISRVSWIGDYIFLVAINEWTSWYSRAKLFMTHLIFYVVLCDVRCSRFDWFYREFYYFCIFF